jgi:hypothetical protein
VYRITRLQKAARTQKRAVEPLMHETRTRSVPEEDLEYRERWKPGARNSEIKLEKEEDKKKKGKK